MNQWALGEGGALASREVGLVVDGWGKEQAGLVEVVCTLREVREGPFPFIVSPVFV